MALAAAVPRGVPIVRLSPSSAALGFDDCEASGFAATEPGDEGLGAGGADVEVGADEAGLDEVAEVVGPTGVGWSNCNQSSSLGASLEAPGTLTG